MITRKQTNINPCQLHIQFSKCITEQEQQVQRRQANHTNTQEQEELIFTLLRTEPTIILGQLTNTDI